MRRFRLFLCLMLFTGSGAAHAQEWRRAPEQEVLLSSNDISPAKLRLEAGRPVRLRFINNSNQTHSFAAPAFFARSQIRKRDAEHVVGGTIRVRPGEERTLALVPEAGRYKMRGGNFFRRLLGMNGTIVVQ